MRILHCIPLLSLAAMATAQWRPAAPAANPPARFQGAMAYDLLNSRTLLFGGAQTGFGNWNDTWAFDGANWSHLAPTASPSARGGHRMVYDQLRGVVVMYGGLSSSFFGGPSIDQTWEFDGTTWTQVVTANSPGGLGWHGMAYDAARARTVLYGGLPNNFFPIDAGDTWEYDGVNWTLRTPTNSPGPLENMGICYAPAFGKTVVFGGIDVQIGGTTVTWGYDGTNWTQFTVTGATPSVRTMPQMFYDSDRGVCVLHGGMDPVNGNLFNDTWEFDGATWTQRTGTAPAARRGFDMVFHQARHEGVMFGGVDATFTGLVDTWNYGAMLDSDFGAGCLGSAGVPIMTANAAAHVGAPFQTTLGNLVPAVPIAIRVTGFTPLVPAPELSFLGLPGCHAYASIDDISVVSASSGTSIAGVTVPNNPALVGGEFYYTGFSFDTVNAFGGVLSNTMHGIIGH